jgi:ribosomal protein S27E
MTGSFERQITCKKCGVPWNVDFAALAEPDSVTFKGAGDRTRVEVFSVRCPNCGHRNAVEVAFREAGDG